MISPIEWLETANSLRPKLPHTTEWFSGTTAPTKPGWYERCFSDSLIIGFSQMQWWSENLWYLHPREMLPHWQQVGDYPCWRGLAEDPNCTTHEAEALGDKGRSEGCA